MKFRLVGSELFHADRRTVRHDEGRFPQFCERVQKKEKNTPAYECVFCHLTICLPLSTPKQKMPSLFLLGGGGSLFHWNFWTLPDLSSYIGSTFSKSYKAICARYSHVRHWTENKVILFLSLSVLRGTHKVRGWGGATAHTTVLAGSGLEPMATW